MKKWQLRKNIKVGCIIFCMAIIGSLAALSYSNYKNPNVDEKKVPLYSYESEGKVNYEVSLKPNTLYDTQSLGENLVYLSNLVDYVDATYMYGFTGEREAEIQGNYEIHAVIEGYNGDGDKLTTVWKKEIPLLAKTNFQANDNKILITKNISLKLQDFNDIANKISNEIKFSTQTKVTTYMNVELSAKTDKGIIEKKSTSSLEVPLAGSYFKIIKNESEKKPEALEEVKQVQKSLDIKLLALLGTGIVLAVITLLILLFGTQSVEMDKFTKKLKKIFKKYGTRLVALNSEITAPSELQSRVHSMEDLVRISDELGKPIIYKHSYNYKGDAKFWVIDEDRFYVFELEVVEPVSGPTSKGHSFKDRVKANGIQERGLGDGVSLDGH